MGARHATADVFASPKVSESASAKKVDAVDKSSPASASSMKCHDVHKKNNPIGLIKAPTRATMKLQPSVTLTLIESPISEKNLTTLL